MTLIQIYSEYVSKIYLINVGTSRMVKLFQRIIAETESMFAEIRLLN